MGGARDVTKYGLTLNEHERCLSYFQGDLEVPDPKKAPREEMDFYVKCAEEFGFAGGFKRDCSIFADGEQRRACAGLVGSKDLVTKVIAAGFILLVGVFVGSRFFGTKSIILEFDQGRRKEEDLFL